MTRIRARGPSCADNEDFIEFHRLQDRVYQPEEPPRPQLIGLQRVAVQVKPVQFQAPAGRQFRHPHFRHDVQPAQGTVD